MHTNRHSDFKTEPNNKKPRKMELKILKDVGADAFSRTKFTLHRHLFHTLQTSTKAFL